MIRRWKLDDAKLNEIVESVVQQLIAAGAVSGTQPPAAIYPVNQPAPALSPAPKPVPTQAPVVASAPSNSRSDLIIDLPDPTTPDQRYKARVKNPKDPAALTELIGSTTARIGVGRAGPRYI